MTENPSSLDICCGRGKGRWNSPGNLRFKKLVLQYLQQYDEAPSKAEKSRVVETVVKAVQSEGGRFLRLDESNGKWFEIGAAESRSKVAHAIRDHLITSRKGESGSVASSKSAKSSSKLARNGTTKKGRDGGKAKKKKDNSATFGFPALSSQIGSDHTTHLSLREPPHIGIPLEPGMVTSGVQHLNLLQGDLQDTHLLALLSSQQPQHHSNSGALGPQRGHTAAAGSSARATQHQELGGLFSTSADALRLSAMEQARQHGMMAAGSSFLPGLMARQTSAMEQTSLSGPASHEGGAASNHPSLSSTIPQVAGLPAQASSAAAPQEDGLQRQQHPSRVSASQQPPRRLDGLASTTYASVHSTAPVETPPQENGRRPAWDPIEEEYSRNDNISELIEPNSIFPPEDE